MVSVCFVSPSFFSRSSQIVSDDIEAIEETIPKLEAFHKTYSGISSDLDDLLDRINGFSMSAITSEGLETKNGALKVKQSPLMLKRKHRINLIHVFPKLQCTCIHVH